MSVKGSGLYSAPVTPAEAGVLSRETEKLDYGACAGMTGPNCIESGKTFDNRVKPPFGGIASVAGESRINLFGSS